MHYEFAVNFVPRSTLWSFFSTQPTSAMLFTHKWHPWCLIMRVQDVMNNGRLVHIATRRSQVHLAYQNRYKTLRGRD